MDWYTLTALSSFFFLQRPMFNSCATRKIGYINSFCRLP
jgi:hypothetical protein